MRNALFLTLVLFSSSCAVERMVQVRYGAEPLDGVVVEDGLHRNLRCVAGDEAPALLGKILTLRDRVTGNPGGWRFIASFWRKPGAGSGPAAMGSPTELAQWAALRLEGGRRLSKCLSLLLQRMPEFHWASSFLAWTRLAMSDAATELARLAERYDIRVGAAAQRLSTKEYVRGLERDANSLLSAARRRLEELLRLRPGYVVAHYQLAEIAALKKEWPNATAAFKRLAAGGADSSHAQAWLGYIAAQQNALGDARAAWLAAIDLDTDEEATEYARYALGFFDVERRSDEVLLMPPYRLDPLPRYPASITHFLMRLAVVNFVDQTQTGGVVHRAIPDLLATRLLKTERFEIYDRGQLRMRPAESIVEKLRADARVDAFVTGAVTAADLGAKQLTVDLRVVGARSDLVLLAKQYVIPFTSKAPATTKHKIHEQQEDTVAFDLEGNAQFAVDLGAVDRIAKDILEAFPRVSDGRVVELAPQHVVVSKGSRDGVFRGMTAYVEAVNEDLVDPKDPSATLGSGTFVGEIYVFSVQANKSLAICFRSDKQRCSLRIGDVVRFK
jgi:hypothetical protein